MWNSILKETVNKTKYEQIIKIFIDLATSSLDSTIRVFNLDDGTKESEIICNPSKNFIFVLQTKCYKEKIKFIIKNECYFEK